MVFQATFDPSHNACKNASAALTTPGMAPPPPRGAKQSGNGNVDGFIWF